MSEGWREYHSRWENRHWLGRAIEHSEFYIRFHRKLRQHLRPGDSLLDIGCGKGYSALYFASLGYDVTGIDPDPVSVEEASAWANRLDLPARFLVRDIFEYSTPQLYRMSYSMGLIEHYPPEDRVRLLSLQVALSEIVVALAPTCHSKRTVEPCPVPWTPQTIKSLKRTFRQAGMEIIDSFGVGNVFSSLDNRVKDALPHKALEILQDRFSYAMGVAVVGCRRIIARSTAARG